MARKDQSITQKLLKVVDDGNLETLRNFLEKEDVDVNSTNKHGESALHIAAGYGRLEIVKELQLHGGYLDATDEQGDTPLYWASRHGHNEVVCHLCKFGVDVNHQDKSGETAAHVASRYGHPEVLQSLTLFDTNLNLQDNEGDTPLLCACWHGFQNIVEILVQSGASLLLRNDDGDTPLHISAVRGNYSIVKYLCEQESEMNSVNKNGHTPLYLATKRNHLDIVQYFCESGSNLNIQDKNGDTPLHEACREGLVSLVYTLFAAQCNLDIQNKNGQTPLHLAAIKGHLEVIRCLCSAGCMLNKHDNNGNTADEVASNHLTASMLRSLRQEGMRDKCLNELRLGTLQVNRVRLLVCGAAGVGKTSLIGSLRTRFLRALRPPKCGGNYLGPLADRHTYGFCVEQCSIPGAGNFSVWDFSGHMGYYPAHEYFLDSRNTIYLVVYSWLHPYEDQLAQIRFWLAMIKSKHRPHKLIHYGGQYGQKPLIVLVQSFSDNPTGLSSFLFDRENEFSATFPVNGFVGGHAFDSAQSSAPNQLIRVLVEEFGHHFMFNDKVFRLDCRQPRGSEIQSLRSVLGTLRQSVLKDQPWVPQLVATLQQVLIKWRQEYAQFPVVTWEGFLAKIQQHVNPLASNERLQIIAKALNDIGEIVYITESHLENLVVLNPDWLGQRIFGPLLAPPERPLDPQFRSVTGLISVREMKRVYSELDPLSVVHLLEHFELCQPVGMGSTIYEFPLLVYMEPLHGLWERDPAHTVYAGIRLQTPSSKTGMFSPGLFPRVQLRTRGVFLEDQEEVTLWSDGLKCRRGRVEACIRQLEVNCVMEIVVRGGRESRAECFGLLKQLYGILMEVIQDCNPSTRFSIKVLSSKCLMEHQKDPHAYSSMEIFDAERTASGIMAQPTLGGTSETVCDLLCCGCQEAELSVKSAPYTSIRDVPLKTRVELCRLLDPPDPFGRDWCLLALQLGVQEEVPAIDKSLDKSSPTDRLLMAWENSSRDTIVTLVDALKGIGRVDVAEELVNGLSPFHNPSNSLVMNIGGAVVSYIV